MASSACIAFVAAVVSDTVAGFGTAEGVVPGCTACSSPKGGAHPVLCLQGYPRTQARSSCERSAGRRAAMRGGYVLAHSGWIQRREPPSLPRLVESKISEGGSGLGVS